MAIPHWTWPDGDAGDASADTDLAAASGTFAVLADDTRAAVLGALYDADAPLSYTDLAAAVGVEDNGRLNYHLRELDDLLVRGGDGYALSADGRAVVETVRDVTAVRSGEENARSPNR
ncbi:winged helix-turn-helix domain-containing protein [Halobacterium yunchengense]|uniref:winged helix-turn-helix domain-containing protein n=1 Tax=Halobacterium yunchengense TaxID=3108497 RepID=UPI00300A3D33